MPPRPLADVALRPLISYALEWLWAADVDHATICAHGPAAALQETLGNSYEGMRLAYRADLLPRGAAGCISDAAEGDDSDTFLIVEGTLIPRLSLPKLLEAHARSAATMTVVTTQGRDGSRDLEPAGIYVMQREALDLISPNGFQDIKETLIPRLFRQGAIVTSYVAGENCPRVADLDSYLHVNHWLVEQFAMAQRGTGLETAQTGDALLADASAVVDPSALLVGPILVGPRARIAAGATVIGPAVIGEDALVDAGALVSRSVLGRSSIVAPAAVVHGSVIADAALVEAGAHVCGRVKLATRSRGSWLQRLVWPSTRPAPAPALVPARSAFRASSNAPEPVRPQAL